MDYVSSSNGWQDICNRPDAPYTVSRPVSSFRVILSIAKDLKTCTEEKLFLAEEFRKVAEALVE